MESQTSTDVEVLAGLDFEAPRIECASASCQHDAEHLVFVTPGPASHPHDIWYPACPSHALHLASGNAKCVACAQRIVLVAIRDL